MPRCDECQYGFTEDPPRIVARCEAFGADMCEILWTNDRDALLRRPDRQTWSPLEYAAHVSEATSWYVARIERVLRETKPQLKALDWDLAASEGRYRLRGVDTVTTDLQRACDALAATASRVTTADLAREGIGSDGTPRTVLALLARAGHELAHHELDIRRGIGIA